MLIFGTVVNCDITENIFLKEVSSTSKTAAEKLARYLVCEKIEDKIFEKEVVEGIMQNSVFEQVCDDELKRLWDSIPNAKTTTVRGEIKML
ncbi:hypothetical protein BN938_1865 [Mucinivorans hirudinis]|uniref:Uncharacterized protein n=1 Tax=Mucinivorans hirudinis TaxID=1433126 RepID=A0A060R8T3_9BACT|nr:hypothetical protein BN938_1865 [Mucinivorans hirudinis]